MNFTEHHPSNMYQICLWWLFFIYRDEEHAHDMMRGDNDEGKDRGGDQVARGKHGSYPLLGCL